MNGAMDFEDYEGGVGQMIAEAQPAEYPDLAPLAQRRTSEIRLKGGGKENDDQNTRYSETIVLLYRQTHKLYGYMRDGNVTDELELAAITGANALADMFFNAPAVNREERYQAEERRAQQWMASVRSIERVEELLHRWSEADAFMLEAKIFEQQRGMIESRRMYRKYAKMSRRRDKARRQASKLPAAENMLFWCRVRQYQIMRERTYELAMNYPVHDYGDVKAKLAEGGNVHDLVHALAWPWQEGYHVVAKSTADGKAFREMLISLYAQQHPPQMAAQMPYGFYPPQYGPNGAAPEGEGGEEQPDNRRPIFGFFGGNKPKQPDDQKQKKPFRRKQRGRR